MPHRILIADDDDAFGSWAAKHLADLGYEVEHVADGDAAVQKAPGAALFLLDVVLPRMLGTEVCVELRQKEQTSDVPVIFLVSNEQELKEISAIDEEDYRAEDFLRKPVSPDTLARVVGKWVGRDRPKGPAPGSERRKVPRVPTDLASEIAEVLASDDSEAVVGPLPPSRVISISEGGAFVLTERPLPEGASMALVLSVPGVEEAIRTEARVVYTRQGPEPGMGVVFTNLQDSDRSRIRLYVELLRRVVRQ